MSTHTSRTDSNCIRFDWAAKYILRDKADFTILEGLVSTVLGEKITITELLESESNQKTKDDKFNRVDIKATNSKGEIILVEIQQSTELYFLQRVLFGVAKTITEHLKLGKNYRKVKKVYSINILYFDFGEGDDYLYHGSNSLIGVNTGDQLKVTADERHGIETVLSEKVFPEYYLLRVEKYDQEETSNAREEWMRYLKWGYIDPETKVPGLREAYERLLELKKDRCVQCMTCEKVCPHKNFSLGNDGLQFAGKCEYCLACVHACPQKALTLKSNWPGAPGERNPEARYRNPNVSLMDIIKSNRQ